MAHTFVKKVNGFKIMHWSIGDKFYVPFGGDWILEHRDLNVVEELARKIKR